MEVTGKYQFLSFEVANAIGKSRPANTYLVVPQLTIQQRIKGDSITGSHLCTGGLLKLQVFAGTVSDFSDLFSGIQHEVTLGSAEYNRAKK